MAPVSSAFDNGLTMPALNEFDVCLAEPDISALTFPDAFVHLHSRSEGLSSLEAEERLTRFGENVLSKPRRTSHLKLLTDNFGHTMALLLWVSGGLAFAANLVQIGTAIWLVNVINGVFSCCQEYKAERASEALLQMLPVHVLVRRDGREEQILSSQLVPGDLLPMPEWLFPKTSAWTSLH
jgi:P-type Ca2+ transporter type 2C